MTLFLFSQEEMVSSSCAMLRSSLMIGHANAAVTDGVKGVSMAKPSEGRIVDLPRATKDQRKAISRVISAIKATVPTSFARIHKDALGYACGLEDEKNLQKGTFSQAKTATLFRWIVAHHLPLASDIAPEVFDPSLLTRWRDFIREHGLYDRLTFSFTNQLGLTQRSRKIPLADTPIPMGKPYLFHLDCGLDGQLLALETKGGTTYPFSLHADERSIIRDVVTGDQTLPQTCDGTPDPLAETEDKGLRCYVLLIAKPDVMQGLADGLHDAHPIALDKLDQIALAFKDADPSTFEVHRLNVVFSG